jgi:hypothetical protein
MSDDSKVIRFPGAFNKGAKPSASAADKPAPTAMAADPAALGADGLTDEQRKGIQVILGGMTFVLIGIKPTDRGADFFTAVHGDATELRNAQGHLEGVIARAFSRKGI